VLLDGATVVLLDGATVVLLDGETVDSVLHPQRTAARTAGKRTVLII
jgi:hypothetical protein